jgi:hypothetical protein
MRELIAIIAAFGLLGCASAAAAPQQKGGGKPPQASTPQIAPATWRHRTRCPAARSAFVPDGLISAGIPYYREELSRTSRNFSASAFGS